MPGDVNGEHVVDRSQISLLQTGVRLDDEGDVGMHAVGAGGHPLPPGSDIRFNVLTDKSRPVGAGSAVTLT
jgi:hypothetical protein